DRGLQVPHLMRFFNTNTWSGYDDSPQGFFETFDTLFSLISSDEFLWSTNPNYYPSFGTSQTPSSSEQIQDLKKFYSTWLNFQTEKDFNWKQGQYQLERDMPRYMRREIEKENLKIRQAAKREYNETVRNLVLFVRRRDPRYKVINQIQTDETAKIKADLLAASKLRALEREKAAQEYESQLQDWEKGNDATKGGGGLESVLREWEEGSELEDHSDGDEGEEGEAEEDERVWCEACNKGYRSGGAWEDHERSRKHLKNLDRLIKEMQKEDELLGLDQTEPPPPLSVSPSLSAQEDIVVATLSIADNSDDDEPERLEKKKKIKRKKKKNVFSSLSVSDNDDSDDEQPDGEKGLQHEEVVVVEEEEERVQGGASSSRKSKKKKVKSKGLPPTGFDIDQAEDEVEVFTPPRGIESDDDNLGGGKKGKKGKQRRAGKMTTTTTRAQSSSRPESRSESIATTPKEEEQEGILEEEMSKKDKRRAREAAKKEAAAKSSNGGSQVICNVCQESFPSRSKLFNHINDTGHALAEGFSPSEGGKKKKGKR
ncbi:hypothetical protein JCM5350_001001, partial [Sporobolomyces pararoseus]